MNGAFNTRLSTVAVLEHKAKPITGKQGGFNGLLFEDNTGPIPASMILKILVWNQVILDTVNGLTSKQVSTFSWQKGIG